VVCVVEAEIDRVLRGLDSLCQASILERHLECCFHRGGAVIREEHVIEPGGRDLDEPPRELGDSRMRGAEQCRVRKSPELRGNSRVDLRNTMAEEVAPQSGRAVEQPPSTIVY
jgi:hypothetical protein